MRPTTQTSTSLLCCLHLVLCPLPCSAADSPPVLRSWLIDLANAAIFIHLLGNLPTTVSVCLPHTTHTFQGVCVIVPSTEAAVPCLCRCLPGEGVYLCNAQADPPCPTHFWEICCVGDLISAISQVWTQPLFSFVEERIFLKFPDATWMQKDLARCT